MRLRYREKIIDNSLVGFRFGENLSVSINLSTRWQASKKEGKFAEHEFVGVRQEKRERLMPYGGEFLPFSVCRHRKAAALLLPSHQK